MSSVRPVLIVFAVLGLAVGGCGTLSTGLVNETSMLASRAPLSAPAETATDVSEPAEAPVETAKDVGEPAAAPVPITYEPITGENAPAWVAALSGPVDPALRGTPDAVPPDPDVEEYDPWEKFNEKMFNFNYNMDKYLLKPAAKGYNFVMPDMFQQMIGNAFQNITVVPKLANNLLQGNWKGLGTELGRFLINSTLGIGGLFDIAKQEFGLQKTMADFGQTLGKWGLGPGPYVIIPFMPPFTVRDGIGYGVDLAMDPLTYVLPFIWDRLGMTLGDIINERSLSLDLFQGIEESTVDLYSSVRNAYLQRRQNLIRGVR